MTAESEPLRSVYDYALAYARAGFSVIPVPKGQKGATIRWGRYQEAPADVAQLAKWFDTLDPPNIALVMGRVSGYAVACDVDHAGFAAFLEEHVLSVTPPNALPLCKRTGSGKLHLIVRSLEPVNTTILRLRGTNETLADIKAEGGYVVGAPSIHPSGGAYRILMGSIESVPVFQNARTVFDQLEALYAQYLGTSVDYLTRPKMQILAPLEGEDRRTIEQEIRKSPISARIRSAILDGAHPEEGSWPTYSEIDFAVCCSLLEADWTPDRIEWVFATFPIGEGCYRDSQRQHHGTSLHNLNVANAQKHLARQSTQAKNAKGRDWEVKAVTRLETDPPKYELKVLCPDGTDRIVRNVSTEDILSDRRMQARLASVFSSVPKFNAAHIGRGYIDFANTLLEMANRESVPKLATEIGFIQELIREFLQTEKIKPTPPAEKGELAGGWVEGDRIYVRSRVLLRHTSQHSIEKVAVWDAARAMGAQETTVSPFEGHTEKVWSLPLNLR